MAMSETPEVPVDEATESKTDMKERMRSFGEKAKACENFSELSSALKASLEDVLSRCPPGEWSS